MFLTSLDHYRDHGLLILRIGFGLIFMYHGGIKLAAGPELWEKVGSAIGIFGITFAPTLWGLAAACSEFFGGVLLILGFLVRPACFFMLFTMLVAMIKHLTAPEEGLMFALHPMKAAVVFLSLIFIGAGKFSLDDRFASRKTGKEGLLPALDDALRRTPVKK